MNRQISYIFLLVFFASCNKPVPSGGNNNFLKSKAYVSAHRGGKDIKGYPGNCLETMKYLHDRGIGMFEIDIALLNDNQLVLMHDDKIDRTTTGHGEIASYSWDQIKSIFLIDDYGDTTSYHIPKLKTVLEWAKKSNTILWLDFKKSVPYDQVIELVKETQMQKQVILISYTPKQAQDLHKLAPNMMLSVSIRNEEEYVRYHQISIPDHQMLAFVGVSEGSKTWYDFLHKKGIMTVVGTLGNLDKKAAARGDEVYSTILNNGADILSSDRPLEAQQKVNEYNNPQWAKYTGIYQAQFQTQGIDVPFILDLSVGEEHLNLCVWNAAERVRFLPGKLVGDSVVFASPIFNTYLIVSLHEGTIEGDFVNKDSGKRISFTAARKPSFSKENYRRFKEQADSCNAVAGKWSVEFNYAGQNQSKERAIGEFFVHENKVFGSFLTETGDFRYLEGIVSKGKLMLSSFDGAVVFMFTGNVEKDHIRQGVFWSGMKQAATWTATRGVKPHFLQDPDAMNKLKDNSNTLQFDFPNIEGGTLSLKDPKYKGKVVIVQIMGTWCHNCMDETQYLNALYQKYHSSGLEIVGLAFETRAKTLEDAKHNVQKTKSYFNINYDLAIATFGKENKAEDFSRQLKHGIMSFPTAIYIGKDGKIKKVHTGFSGPGTSNYDEFVKENNSYVYQLLQQ